MIRFARTVFALIVFACVAPAVNAAPIVFTAFLDGPSESPPNASPGTGSATVEFDVMTHTMRIVASFSDLIGVTTAAHIHAPTAAPGTGVTGVATMTPFFAGFPIGVTSGSYDMTFDTTLTATYSAAFVTANGGTAAGAEAALLASLEAGTAYFNIHTTVFPPGEIRGFLARQLPEPGTLAVFGVGLAGLAFLRRRASA